MSGLLELGWWIWAPLCAWMSRALVVRVWRSRLGDGAFIAGYGGWIVSLIVGLAYVEWSGMQMYGFNPDDVWQVSGWVVLFFSPFGLPVLFGGPIIFLIDLIRFVIRARKTDPVVAD